MKKFRLLFALCLCLSSLAAYSRADTVPQPEKAISFRDWVRQAQAANTPRTAAGLYLRAAETAPDNEQRYWALVEAGKRFHEARAYPQAVETFARAEKLDGITGLARFDAGLQAAHSTRTQINSTSPKTPRDFAPAYAAYRRLFTLPGLEPYPRKLAHAGLATIYSDDGKHLEAALEYEKGEKVHLATDNGLYQSAYEEFGRLKPTSVALAPIERMATQVARRKIYDSKKQLYRPKTAAEINADKLRWAKLKKRHSQYKS